MFKFVIVILLCIVLFLRFNWTENNLQVHFLDVGQGDAILIRTPQGQNILVDGGEDNILLSEVANVLPWWERTIDYVIVSHYHADHIMGFMELFNKYRVKNILVANHQPEDFLYQVWLDSLVKHELEVKIVQAGEKFNISPDLYWQVLLADDYHEDYNENSLVIKLTYQDIDYLLMGDLPTEGEERLLKSNFNLQSEVLKVGHHGSKYSSSAEFLEAVKPQYCIIQSGEGNKFGHPHEEAVLRLKEVGCQVRNTQYEGRISTFSDGELVF